MYWCHNDRAPQGELLTLLLNGAGKVSRFTVLTLILFLVQTEPTFPLQCTVKHATTKCLERWWRSVETDMHNTIYSTVLPLWRGLPVLQPELLLVKQTWIGFVFLHLWWVLLRYKQSLYDNQPSWRMRGCDEKVLSMQCTSSSSYLK
jgi:hypothetical protein